jgi:pyruvate dehydrogenase E2 component (dihydrolipoamide acetyltransferase)
VAIEIVMPRLGWNMEVGTVVEWLKHDGDRVNIGDYIFMVEGDKSVSEVEALDSGILRIPDNALRLGEELPVGTLLAYLVQEGEQVGSPSASPAAESAPTSAATAPADPASMSAAPAQGRRTRGPIASPRAIRVAKQLGVDWRTLTGTGRTGRIREQDVRAAYDRAAATTPAPVVTSPVPVPVAAPPLAAPAAAPKSATPLSQVRRLTAERMARSAHTAAPVTLTTEADATALVRLRGELAAGLAGTTSPVPSYNDFFVKLVAVVLGEFPDLNASFTDGGIVRHGAAHIGVAVDTERGLLVPVVRDAQAKAVQAIAAETAALIAQARAGTAPHDALGGGTFTITNLGMYEIDAFTPIINLPECAILGVGRIVARPVVIDEATDTVAVRKMVALSLTFDHRVVDGGPAARFLQRIKRYVEQPLVWLTR